MRAREIRMAAAVACGLVAVLASSTARTAHESPRSFYHHLVGVLHAHSGYSDGWPGTQPADYYAAAKAHALDFLGSSEHAELESVPLTYNGECLGSTLPECVTVGTEDPLLTVQEWEANLEQANAASDAAFAGFRGFEWTSERFGHINVYFSRNYTSSITDGGYASLDTFWRWFGADPALGGGADGLGTFNHPGDRKFVFTEPVNNWHDFAYVPEVDERMVGLEVYNAFRRTKDYGTWYVYALDQGWHVGAVGTEDKHTLEWGAPQWAKTIVIAPDRSTAALRRALLARRFYAVAEPGIRLDFEIDRRPMGSRLARADGDTLKIRASVNDPAVTLDLVTRGGAVVTSDTGKLNLKRTANAAEPYYFVRAVRAGAPVAYSSPVWIAAEPRPPSVQGEWLAGDLHVHTCYSHDVYCGPGDDNTGADEFYTAGFTVAQRFLEAAARGLDFLAISDHNDVRSVSDPGFGTQGVIGIPAYENSLRGHAQMLGATTVYDAGDRSTAAVLDLRDALRRAGGVFQINHPADDLQTAMATCVDTTGLDWQYGYEVAPDTIEVWNVSPLLQPPAPSGNSNDDAIKYWECWLARGARVAATGGSDAHWAATAAHGAGHPTTWVFARGHSAPGVLQGLREGRTSVSLVPPAEGGLQLLLEGDADGDGVYESLIGDAVPPGAALRVRALGWPGAGVVQVRVNGRTLVDGALLAPGGEVRFSAPAEPGWVRATLLVPDASAERTARCDPMLGGLTSYCRNSLSIAALTSPIYVATHGDR